MAIKIPLIIVHQAGKAPPNASDIRPAVIIAIEAPLNGAGTSAAAMRSLIGQTGSGRWRSLKQHQNRKQWIL